MLINPFAVLVARTSPNKPFWLARVQLLNFQLKLGDGSRCKFIGPFKPIVIFSLVLCTICILPLAWFPRFSRIARLHKFTRRWLWETWYIMQMILLFSAQSSLRFYRLLKTVWTPNGNFRENICSQDDLRARIFGTFVVKFLACLLLLGFSNI